MNAEFTYHNKNYKVDLSKPLDISIPLNGPNPMVTAWYVPDTKIEPVVSGDWIGSVEKGAPVNFNNITFNPHGNGTHTECIGHITSEDQSINQQLKSFFFIAELISVELENKGDDKVILVSQFEKLLSKKTPEAIIIRTMPNPVGKLHTNYSNTNPPYLSEEAARLICKHGIKHLLIDLPSVDKEVDDGKLLAHKAFWDLNGSPRLDATITELVFIADDIPDGTYLLNLQFAPFENDASPSRPVLFQTI